MESLDLWELLNGHIPHACCIAAALLTGVVTTIAMHRIRKHRPTYVPIQPNVMCRRCWVSVDVIKEPGTDRFVAVCPVCKSYWPLPE